MLQMFVLALSLYNTIEFKVSFFYAKSQTCSFIVFDLKCTSNIPILLILKPDSVKEKLIYFNLEVDGFISYPFNEKEIIEELKHSGRN